MSGWSLDERAGIQVRAGLGIGRVAVKARS